MKIDIVGGGNVATHLYRALRDKADVKAVSSRTLDGLRPDSDVVIISVSDSAIRDVASEIAQTECKAGRIVAHTSGTTPLSVLEMIDGPVGVFYPMQTFSKDVALDYSEIPFFIEGKDKLTENTLYDVARLISEHVTIADSEKRRNLHVASVLSCNFVNHLWALADRYLSENGLSFNAMHPLIKETVRKACNNHPADVQTGPAARGDIKIINEHLDALDNDPDIQKIYKDITESIMNHNERN